MATDSKDLIPQEDASQSPEPHREVQGDIVGGDKVAGDVIVTGDISGSYIAIGRGAQVIVQQVMSAVEEAEQRHQVETRILAQSLAGYVERLRVQIPQTSATAAQTEPYKSLLPYRMADAPFFFGRDRALADLMRDLSSPNWGRLTVLHSESGAGKTSLLQAGLAARLLAQGHLPLYVRPWRHAPGMAVKQTILPDLDRTPQLAQLSLRPFLKRLTGVLGLATVVYILFDQFEEFFVRVAEESRQEFIEELGECIEDETLRVRFVLSLRKDHFASLSEFRSRIPYIFSNEYSLKLFTRTEAVSAIQSPAALAGLTYESDVVERLLDELQGDAHGVIMPAQLQLVCWALYRELQGEQRRITVEALAQMGGVAGILRNYLQRVLTREIPPSQQDQARRVLEALVRSDRSRDIQTVDQLCREMETAEQLPPVLEALVGSRLLRVVEIGPEEVVAYELAHDYLVDQIELDPAVLARKAAQELLDQAVDVWKRDPKLLIGEEQFKTIEKQEPVLKFSPEAKELYTCSRKKYRRQKFLRWGLLGGVILAVCIALFLLQRLIIASTNLQIAEDSLVTATSVIRTAQDAAVVAEGRRNVAQTAEAEAVWAEAAARAAGAKAESAASTAAIARQTAEAGQRLAVAAEATAVRSQQLAQTRQAEAQQQADAARMGEATAEAARSQAVTAQQAAQASQSTAEAGRQLAQQAQQTAVAEQAQAEAAAVDAQAAAVAAQQAQAQAEAAQQAAESARRTAEKAQEAAEREARQARREQTQAEQSAQQAEATRVAVEVLRDQAEEALRETQRVAAIIRDTKNCPVGSNPSALAFDGAHIWVTSKVDETVTKLRATDCTNLGNFATGSAPWDVIYGDGFIWVANRLSNSVQKLRVSDGATVATFTAGPPGSEPTRLLFDGTALWVVSDGTHRIRKINPDTGATLGTFETGQGPSDLVYDGSIIWIANGSDNSVWRINPATGASVGASIPVGARPAALLYDGTYVWVANRNGDTITKLRALDGAVLGTFPTAPFPDALASDGNDIWSVNMDHNTLTRFQPNDGTLLSTVPTGTTPTAMLFDGANMWVVAEDDGLVQKIPVTIHLTGREPMALAYDGLYLWVANRADNTVSKMLASTGKWVATVGVGDEPTALLTVGNHLWVANRGDNTVSKLRGSDGSSVGTYPVGRVPSALAFDGTDIWVTNEDDDSVTRLREADGSQTGTFLVGDRPVDILFDGSHLWVANERDQSLVKLRRDGGVVKTVGLGIAPRSFLYDGTYFWIGYTVAAPASPETRVLQLLAADGSQVSDTGIGVTGSSAIAPAAVTYDGTYVWVTSPNTIGDGIVGRLAAANPANFGNFPVCDEVSAVLYTGSVWLTCKEKGMIQKLPGDGGATGALNLGQSLLIEPVHHYLPIILK